MNTVFYILSLIFLATSTAFAASSVTTPHVTATLITESNTALAGETLKVGINFDLEPGWHLYWINPGDSGEAVRIEWQLPEGVKVGDVEWPAPKRIPVGPLVNFGYERSVLLPVTLELPKAEGLNSLLVRARVHWLVCQEECIPGDAELDSSLSITPAPRVPSLEASLFTKAQQSKPKKMPSRWNIEANWQAGEVKLNLRTGSIPAAAEVFFFPKMQGILQNAAPQAAAFHQDGFTLTLLLEENLLTPPADLAGLLKIDEVFYEVVFPGANSKAPPLGANLTVLNALLWAFLGGLILNAMPCVFPVLSIKAVGLLRQADVHRGRARLYGGLYGIGVLVSFWLLASVLIAVRAGGEQWGWGFQLQSPLSIFALAFLLFIMGLNLVGVFEIRASWVGLGHGLASRQEGIGAFFSGVLATFVATPCTAPFMGTALGFAAVQPAPIALAVFTALALGLAAPYVMLSWFPSFGRWLPKPGRWMETFKQIMAFPLFATVIWLIWVLDHQAGANAVAGALAAFLLVAIALWIYQRWQQPFGVTVALFSMILALGLGIYTVRAQAVLASTSASQPQLWESYSQKRLKDLLAQGTPVFIDFTAAWCVTCKINETVALGPSMIQIMRSQGVVPMKADWTNGDPEITTALRSFGRDGVPLYVLYDHSGNSPRILPQILSKTLIIDALEQLKGKQELK